MTKTGFIDVHVLHTVPFSNLNRDNLGSPKQMIFGGTARSRISSQCTKRAVRLWLEANTDLGEALRTRRLPQMLHDRLVTDHDFTVDAAAAAAAAVFALAGIKVGNVADEGDTMKLQGDQLTFTTTEAAADLAAVVAEHRDEILAESFKPNKRVAAELLAPICARNPIISLCGRMLASVPGSNVDGALQVAHAFTTHTASLELDYFTAVDDHTSIDPEEAGSAHINVNEFTSGVFYRHATVGLAQLNESLDNGAAAAGIVGSFVRAFTLAEPTGKQNAANAHTLPALVAVTWRTDRPASFAAAFEQPVAAARSGGHTTASIARLAEHAAADSALYGTEGTAGAWHAANSAAAGGDIVGLGERCADMASLVATVEAALGGGS